MIKHLLTPIPLVVMLLAGCDGWFVPCDATHTVYCTLPNGDNGACGAEGIETYYVWYLDSQCGAQSKSYCDESAEGAQAQADSDLSDVLHGSVSTDPKATMPQLLSFCPTGSCEIGSADGSSTTSFSVFSADQIAGCELAYDPTQSCTWPQTESTCGPSM